MKKITLTIALLLASLLLAYTQDSQDSYRDDLSNYLSLSGTDLSFDATIEQVIMMLGPSLSEDKKTEVKKEAFEKLIDYMLPIYRRNISQEDLNALIDFYNSPSGKRISAAQPAIINETTQVSMQWANDLQGIIRDSQMIFDFNEN